MNVIQNIVGWDLAFDCWCDLWVRRLFISQNKSMDASDQINSESTLNIGI